MAGSEPVRSAGNNRSLENRKRTNAICPRCYVRDSNVMFVEVEFVAQNNGFPAEEQEKSPGATTTTVNFTFLRDPREFHDMLLINPSRGCTSSGHISIGFIIVNV